MIAELVKPVGDGGDRPEQEREGGAAVVSQVKGLNGVSDQTFLTLFVHFLLEVKCSPSFKTIVSFCITQNVSALYSFLYNAWLPSTPQVV